jgi:hypothetical protein
MHARQSVTSWRDTEPAGNSSKSSTSFTDAAFAFDAPTLFDFDKIDFDAEAFDTTDFDAEAFDAARFDADFDATAFAPVLAVVAALAFLEAAALTLGGDKGLAFFEAVFDLALVAAII